MECQRLYPVHSDWDEKGEPKVRDQGTQAGKRLERVGRQRRQSGVDGGAVGHGWTVMRAVAVASRADVVPLRRRIVDDEGRVGQTRPGREGEDAGR